MTTTATALQIITNTEAQDELGNTRGWIVPAGTSPDADLELEAVDHVDIPATEDEAQWWQGFSSALANDGYALTGEIIQDEARIVATVEHVA